MPCWKNKRLFPYIPALSLLQHYLKLFSHMKLESLFNLNKPRGDSKGTGRGYSDTRLQRSALLMKFWYAMFIHRKGEKSFQVATEQTNMLILGWAAQSTFTLIAMQATRTLDACECGKLLWGHPLWNHSAFLGSSLGNTPNTHNPLQSTLPLKPLALSLARQISRTAKDTLWGCC